MCDCDWDTGLRASGGWHVCPTTEEWIVHTFSSKKSQVRRYLLWNILFKDEVKRLPCLVEGEVFPGDELRQNLQSQHCRYRQAQGPPLVPQATRVRM